MNNFFLCYYFIPFSFSFLVLFFRYSFLSFSLSSKILFRSAASFTYSDDELPSRMKLFPATSGETKKSTWYEGLFIFRKSSWHISLIVFRIYLFIHLSVGYLMAAYQLHSYTAKWQITTKNMSQDNLCPMQVIPLPYSDHGRTDYNVQ
jgi:hypothetical protein